MLRGEPQDAEAGAFLAQRTVVTALWQEHLGNPAP